MHLLSYKTQRYLILITFLTVPIGLLLVFSFYPALMLLYQSFTSWNGLDAEKQWIGFANYVELFSNRELFEVLSHNTYYVVAGIIQNIIALYFAVILNGKLRARNMFRVIIFMPYIINGVAVAYIFSYIYDTHHGALNLILSTFGLIDTPISWLGTASIVNYSLAFIAVWKYMGFNMIIYLGALQAIPEDVYEAAKIDGASGWQIFWRITLPNMKRIVELSLFLTLAGGLEAFDLPFVLTKGGPMGASETFITKTVNTAFQFQNFGLASAMAIVLLAIVIILVTIQRKLLLRGDD